MSLAVEALLLAVEPSGRTPRGVRPRLLVAAACLAELVLAGRVGVVDGRVRVLSPEPLAGPAGRLLLRIAAERRPRSLRRWFTRSLGPSWHAATQQAALDGRLRVSGTALLRRRVPLDRAGRQQAVDRWRDLLAGRPVTTQQATLARLAADTGYGFRLVADPAKARAVAPATRLATGDLPAEVLALAAEIRRNYVLQRVNLAGFAVAGLLSRVVSDHLGHAT